MTTHENSCSRPGGAESRLNSQSFVNKWRVADPNIIFEKNQKLVLLSLTCKPSPIPAKSVGACAKFKIYLRRWRSKTRADICILDGLLFMWGVLPSFRSRVSVAASQKIRFWHFKNRKSTFHGRKWESVSMAFIAIPVPTRVSDMASFHKLCHDWDQT
jgi:hypothetical protein